MTYLRKLDTLGYILTLSVKSPLVTTPTVKLKKTFWLCRISETACLRATLMKHKIVANSILGGIDISDVKIGQSKGKLVIYFTFFRANSGKFGTFPNVYLLFQFGFNNRLKVFEI